MHKRGQLISYHALIELVLLIFIASAFFYFHKTVQENTVFEKSYVARDIALLLETVQAVPGEIIVYYNQPEFDVGKYNYDFSNNLFTVSEENIATSIYYSYFLDKTLTAPLPTFQHPAAFVISKTHSILEILEYASLKQENPALTCPNYASTKKQQLSIAVVADSSTAQLQNYLINNPTILFAKKYKEPVEETDLVIVFSAESGKTIEAYYPTGDEQSEKIACLLANSIFNEIIAKIPDAIIEYPERSSDDMLHINSNGIAVQIVIGEELLAESTSIKNALKSGLEEYYE
jgi:hypothetical protein